jgi:hypoxanthine phosphoribosyltransferase
MRALIEAAEIQRRVVELGRQITGDYQGRPLTIVGVLTGGMILASDLMRAVDLPLRVAMLQASSYRGRSTAPGDLVLDSRILPDIRGRDVLVVDDIFDTGRTLTAVTALIEAAGAHSVRCAVLLAKEIARPAPWQPQYVGFRIPDVFVVGYGLDYNDEHRCLPYIAALEAGEL